MSPAVDNFKADQIRPVKLACFGRRQLVPRHAYITPSQLHSRFAVCDTYGRVLAAVDLTSERSPPSLRAQRVKAAVLHACGVRYLTCTADAMPSLPTLRALVPQAYGEQGAGAVVHGPHPLAHAGHAAAGHAATAAAAGGEFDDSFFLPPSDSVLGELSSTAAADGPRTHH